MDEKLKTIEKELEQTRSALRWQTKRCHHLVSALTVKLEQRDAEVKAMQGTREGQLSQILRALLVLEARLRREQRSIRAQLGSRDALIREQQLEIVRLKKLTEPQRPISPPENFQNEPSDYECHVKPDLISSLGIWQHPHKHEKPSILHNGIHNAKHSEDSAESLVANLITPSQDVGVRKSQTPSSTSKVINETTLDRTSSSSILKPSVDEDDGLKTVNKTSTSPKVNDKTARLNEITEKSIISDKNNRKDERLEKSVTISDIIQVRTHPDDVSVPESADSFTIIHDISKLPENISTNGYCMEIDVKPLPPSALLHEMQVQSKSGKNEYHDNPVLECVNQILLRDQEEFLEEQRVLRMREADRNRNESLNLSKSRSREDLTRMHHHKDKAVSPNRKSIQNNFHDKPPCLMAPPQLSLLGTVNFNESSDLLNHELNPKQQNNLKTSPQGRGLVPPALPPKPLRLLSIKSSADFTVDGVKMKQPSSVQSQNPLQMQSQQFELDIRAIESNHPLLIGKSPPALPEPNSEDNELYVISNSALDDDIVQQLQGRNIRNCSELKKALHPEQKRIDVTHASIHFPTGKKKETTNSEIITSPKPSVNIVEKRKSTPVKSTSMPFIKVASPVSSLLATVENITDKQTEKESPQSVSQIVRRFEHLGSNEKLQASANLEEDGNNALRKNFEEFRLDECDMDVLSCVSSNDSDGRPEADGAENRLNGSVNTTTPATTVMPSEAGVSYENFLEATGLSQKSIMTPSRIFSNNHRNVLKPKDVKHRSRVKAAATVANPTVRYWTEPFL